MTIPVHMTLPEPLRRVQLSLTFHCPYNNQDGYDRDVLRRLADHGHREELDALFIYVIAHATSTMDMEYVWFLRCVHPYDFDGIVPILTEECFRDLEHRSHSDTIASIRNPAFERVLIEEKLSDETLRYMPYTTQPSHQLLRVLALRHRSEADMIALRATTERRITGQSDSCGQRVGVRPDSTDATTIRGGIRAIRRFPCGAAYRVTIPSPTPTQDPYQAVSW